MTDARISRAATEAFIQPDTAARQVTRSLTDAAIGVDSPPRQASQVSTGVLVQPPAPPRQVSRVQTDVLVPTWHTTVLASDPVMYWKLDETKTSPIDPEWYSRDPNSTYAPRVRTDDSSGNGFHGNYWPSLYDQTGPMPRPSLVPNHPYGNAQWTDRDFMAIAATYRVYDGSSNIIVDTTPDSRTVAPFSAITVMVSIANLTAPTPGSFVSFLGMLGVGFPHLGFPVSGEHAGGRAQTVGWAEGFYDPEWQATRYHFHDTGIHWRELGDGNAHLLVATLSATNGTGLPDDKASVTVWLDGVLRATTPPFILRYTEDNYEHDTIPGVYTYNAVSVGSDAINGDGWDSRYEYVIDEFAGWNRPFAQTDVDTLMAAWGPKPPAEGDATLTGSSSATLAPETVVEGARVLSGDSNLTVVSHQTIQGGAVLEGSSDASLYLPPPVIGGGTLSGRGDGEMYPASNQDLRLVFWIPKSTVHVTPTSVLGFVTNAQPHEEIDFVLRGKVIYTDEADSDGDLMGSSIPLTWQNHGDYQIYARPHQNRGRGSSSETVHVSRDQYGSPRVIPPDARPVEIPDANTYWHHHEDHGNQNQPYYDPAVHDVSYSHLKHRHWVLQDLAPNGIGSWVLPINPSSQTSPHWKRGLTVSHTTSSSGRDIVWQQAGQPTEWSFSGYCPDKKFHDNLLAYRELPRRIYIIDHRNRAWVAVITTVDLVARNDPYNKWAHNYTVNTLVHRYGDVVSNDRGEGDSTYDDKGGLS